MEKRVPLSSQRVYVDVSKTSVCVVYSYYIKIKGTSVAYNECEKLKTEMLKKKFEMKALKKGLDKKYYAEVATSLFSPTFNKRSFLTCKG